MKLVESVENTFSYKINERMVNLIIALLGVIGIMAGVLLPDETHKTIVLSIGTSLLASSVVTYLSSIYIYKRRKERNIVETWGLNAIYETRQEMNRSCDLHFDEMEENFDIIAFGLRSLRDAQGKKIENKVKKGLKVRILTINPESIFLEQREKDEDKTPGSIKDSILQLTKWMKKLQRLAPKSDNVQLKYYDALPLDFYDREDNYIYIGPYQYKKDSQQTISFEFSGNMKMGYNYYKEYFEEIWGDEDFGKRIV